mmetsp:Transcript_42235/g.106388  ORF Transcript_42235/g.106388 Transcript_42235/m.106388 type:complete len:434 (+) Transcript_42235:90-1391(+)
MSFDSSTKKPLAQEGASAGACVGTDAHPAVTEAGIEEAKQPGSPSSIEPMGIETPAQTPEQTSRRPSHWSGSFGGPSERAGKERNFANYFRSLYQEPDMDKFTDLAVTMSTIPFLFIQIPQIISNFTEKIPRAWTGIVSGGMGNLLLCTFFADGGEWAQARVQAIGAITNIFVVAQARFIPTDPIVPIVPFIGVMVIMVAGLVIPLLKATGKADKFFAPWLKGTTIIGATVLCFALTYSIMDDGPALVDGPGETSRTCVKDDNAEQEDSFGPDLMIPGIVSLVGFSVSTLCVYCGITTSSTGGILATALFMYMPVPQLIKNLVNPAEGMGFNLGFVYFGVLGNGLGLSRALYTRNYVWLSGSSWGCFGGGVIMSITVLVANAQCDKAFLSTTGVVLLVAFNAAFLIYSAALFYCTLAWNLRPKPPSQRELNLA